MSTSTHRVLILGHSFVRRLFDFVHEQNLSTFGLSQCVVYGVGVSGATVDKLQTDRTVHEKISHIQPHIIILQIGGNCLCNNDIRPDQLAYKIFHFARHLHDTYGSHVYVCEIFPRPRPRGISASLYESRRFAANKALHVLFISPELLHVWSHRRLFNSPLDLFLRDGCHLNPTGSRKFYRSVRLAIMHACRQLSTQ
ncbi:hypothetical protein KP79_PYT19752 [Mizuhopecten yessoensis]|uniref:SGNH hydrolase-type esterase domain-containing protein n=1 Tax=Mizuhopecten yessoensis TaxID=6573 RepID=A0A210QZV1_MIZYE|nr:hypothetical protein KP79_PYT19752 [Mizuhopecten yessoensis]